MPSCIACPSTRSQSGAKKMSRTALSIAKVGFGRKPALYPAGAESRIFDMALKLSKMV